MSYQSAEGKNHTTGTFTARSSRALIAILALLCGAASVDAALVLYTDRAAWRAAAGGGTGGITDNLDTGTTTRVGYTLGGSALSFPSLEADTDINGTAHARFDLGGSDTGLFTFSSAITALGFDINSHPFDIGLGVLVDIDGVETSGYQLPENDEETVFVGFVSDSPFTTFGISPENDWAYHGVDNLEAFIAPVPEPSTYFAMGFLVLAAGCHFYRTRGNSAVG